MKSEQWTICTVGIGILAQTIVTGHPDLAHWFNPHNPINARYSHFHWLEMSLCGFRYIYPSSKPTDMTYHVQSLDVGFLHLWSIVSRWLFLIDTVQYPFHPKSRHILARVIFKWLKDPMCWNSDMTSNGLVTIQCRAAEDFVCCFKETAADLVIRFNTFLNVLVTTEALWLL